MNSYMLQQFNKRFWGYGAVICIVYSAIATLLLADIGTKLWVVLLICPLTEVAIYFILHSKVKELSHDINDVADIMVKLICDEDIPGEQYKLGEIGEVYTNLYKLVLALRDSRMREQKEKDFLRDTMSDISHQLKTPLSSLTVFIDLLYDNKVKDEQKQKQLLEESRNQLSRMQWLILSMLKLARIEAGAIQFDNRESDLTGIFARAVEAVDYLTKDRGQNIVVLCDNNAVLNCDGDWLVEALINLLKNASDYSGEGTTITIEAEVNTMYTRLYVRDNGIGIAEEYLPHIFKRFYRVKREINPNSVGIGLALTKSIIEGMGGKITVRSEPGRYTEFIMTFVHTV